MAKKTVVVATILASFLVIGAEPGRAQPWHRDGYHAGYEPARLEVLSHRLEASVRHLQRVAERRIDDPGRRERRALRALRVLARRADRFHARVERRPHAVRTLIADFRALDESFRRAERRVQRLHAPRMQREVGRIGLLVERIERQLDRRVRIARHRGPRQVIERGPHPRYGGFAWRW
jgi:hypothetical protein